MIVDTSALVAVLRREQDSPRYEAMLSNDEPASMSAASYLETGIVLDRSADRIDARRLDEAVRIFEITLADVTEAQAKIARQAYRDFGKGSGHKAQLNFGDCFAYALAIDSGEPLLFKGDEFGHTDVRRAL